MIYQIVSGINKDVLSKFVNEQLADEWLPLGSPYTDRGGLHHQAMIKYPKQENKG